MSTNELMTTKDLAEYLGMSESSIYRKRSLGENLPRALKLGGGTIRWRKSDVDAWLESCLEDDAK